MNLLKERMKLVLKENGVSVNFLAKTFSVNQKSLNDQINADVRVGFQTIELLLEYFPNLSAEWLLRGEGDMLKADTTPLPLADVTQDLSSNSEEEIAKLQEQLDQQKEFNALQKEYVADLKERIKEYQERVSELKDTIHELKKEHHSASVHHAKNA
jgi:polyhydroxyalkanoate synthesis regulator phasin